MNDPAIQMQQNRFSASDLQLLEVLQINPRISWTAASRVLGADPVTLARRWDRLQKAGAAWTGASESAGYACLVDVRCSPNEARTVARALATQPEAFAVDLTSGARDILITVRANSLEEIWHFTEDTVGSTPGVIETRTNLMTARVTDASTWRLQALDSAGAAQVPGPKPARARAVRDVSEEVATAIIGSLTLDARRSVREIAKSHRISEARVADGVARLFEQHKLAVWADVRREKTDWPFFAWFFLDIPTSLVAGLRTRMNGIPQVRASVMLASQSNCAIAAWLQNVEQVPAFEAALERSLPGARVADRSVVFDSVKQMGRVL